MSRSMLTCMLALALAGAGCGGTTDDQEDGGTDADPADATPDVEDDTNDDAIEDTVEDPGTDGGECGTAEFGDTCTGDEDCGTCVCFTFGDDSSLCTYECTSDDECPEGSRGRRCNSYGYCRP